MKTSLTIPVFLLIFNLCQAQSGTNNLLQKLPVIPTNLCDASRETQQQYEEQITALIRELDAQIKALKKQSKPDEAQAKLQAGQMLSQQGVSQEDIAKMKSKKMTKDDKMAMANQAMQQYTNMSMDEIKSMKKMSKDGKQAYTEVYAAEAQATAQANAKNNPVSGVNTTNNADVFSQRSDFYQKLKMQQEDVLLNYRYVDQDVEGVEIVGRINSLRARMKQLVGGGGEGGWNPKDKKEYDAAEAEVKHLKKEYCEHMSPLYVSALKNHQANLKSSYNDYQKLDEMTGKIDNSIVTIGTTGKGGNIEYFDWVKNYLNHLKESYKYTPGE